MTTRFRLFRLPLLLLLALGVPGARAQSVGMEGRTVARGWPDPMPEGRATRAYAALPSMDTLALGYRIADAGSAPSVEVAFRWTAGREAIFEGRRVPYDRLPSGLRLVALVLTADVVQDGRRVGGFTLDVDSTRLAAGQTLTLVPGVAWSHLFDGLGAEEARQAVRSGAALANVRLVRAAFATFDTRRVPRRYGARTRSGAEVGYPTVVVLDHALHAAWDIAWLVNGPSTRFGWDRLADLMDEADGDDDTELLVPALAGAAMVGVAAWQAGSIGLYAADGAPLGLTGGFTGERVGVYAQVGVSLSVLGLLDRPERLQARLLAFGRRPGWRIAPYVGAGAEVYEPIACAGASCAATDGLSARPVVTLGLAVPTPRLVVLIGADAETGRLQGGVIGRFGRSRGPQRR